MSGDYFGLEVFAHEVVLYESAALPSLPTSNPFTTGRHASLPGCCALAFQFLDYPLLLVYANPYDEPQWAISGGANSQVHRFCSGKKTIIQADREELQFLLEEVGQERNPVHCNLLLATCCYFQ
eukprot:1137563-Pelagomonas_calceolata.AAC.3